VSYGFADFAQFSSYLPSSTSNSNKNSQLQRFIAFRRKPLSAYTHALSLRTNTVEQSVDNPFMAVSTPCTVWRVVGCSFFEQNRTSKIGA
jgi:isopentenyl diphosphate isomerase/L-lactate dehydrogenase-like FMN-dependent dehydrogenase